MREYAGSSCGLGGDSICLECEYILVMIMIVDRARILGLPRSAHRNHCAVVTAALLAASLRKRCTNYTQWHLLRFLFHISVLKAEAMADG